MTSRRQMETVGWDVSYENEWLTIFHIPMLYRDSRSLWTFSNLFDFSISNMGTKEKSSKYMLITICGFHIHVRLKKG